MPSRNLDRYLRARASNATVEQACEQSGIGAGEAELWEADIASGEVELPRVDFSARPSGDENRQGAPRVCAGAGAGAREGEDQPKEEGAFMARDNENVRTAEQTVAADELRLFIERVERLSEERKGIADDISDVYTEAKNRGYDKPTMRRIIRLRAMDADARAEAAALLETYANALGLQGALPL